MPCHVFLGSLENRSTSMKMELGTTGSRGGYMRWMSRVQNFRIRNFQTKTIYIHRRCPLRWANVWMFQMLVPGSFKSRLSILQLFCSTMRWRIICLGRTLKTKCWKVKLSTNVLIMLCEVDDSGSTWVRMVEDCLLCIQWKIWRNWQMMYIKMLVIMERKLYGRWWRKGIMYLVLRSG